MKVSAPPASMSPTSPSATKSKAKATAAFPEVHAVALSQTGPEAELAATRGQPVVVRPLDESAIDARGPFGPTIAKNATWRSSPRWCQARQPRRRHGARPSDQAGVREGTRGGRQGQVRAAGAERRRRRSPRAGVSPRPPGTSAPCRLLISGQREALVGDGSQVAPSEQRAPERLQVAPGRADRAQPCDDHTVAHRRASPPVARPWHPRMPRRWPDLAKVRTSPRRASGTVNRHVALWISNRSSPGRAPNPP